jgi:outer membrane receptor for ferrienterochelin and colicins
VFKNLLCICFLSFIICATAKLQAQENRILLDTLEILSLEELMNIPVVTASKTRENLQDAPAIVSVVTDREIENYGANNLLDVLDRVCSIYNLGSALLPNNVISVRGDQTTHYNQHVLVLIDGRPIRESLAGGIRMAFNTVFPVSRIARVEIIRGPGSVLYGTGAYTGVINVITKVGGRQQVSGQIMVGSFGRKQANLQGGKSLGALSLAAGINGVDETGWDFTAYDGGGFSTPPNYQQRTIQMSNKGLGANFSAEYKGFHLTTYYGSSRQRAMYFPQQWSGTTLISGKDTTKNFPYNYVSGHQMAFADLGYKKDITPGWSLGINLTLNNIWLEEIAEGGIDDIARAKSNDQLLELTNYFKIGNTLHVVLGGLANRQTGRQDFPISTVVPVTNENPLGLGGFGTYNLFNFNNGENPNPFAIIKPYNETWYSAYLQADFTPFKSSALYALSKLKFVAGGQLNNVPDIDLSIVPQVGVVAPLSEEWNIKLLYGMAFRAATANERFIKVNFVYGTENIQPETIRTIEASLGYKSKSNQFSGTFTFFNSLQKNLIGRTNDLLPNNKKQTFYRNLGEHFSQGVEIDYTILLSHKFSVSGSQSVLFNEDRLEEPEFIELPGQTNVKDQDKLYNRGKIINYTRTNFQGLPQFMFKIGASYQITKGLNASVFQGYYQGADVATVGATGSVLPSLNPLIKDFNLLSAQVRLNVGQLFQISFDNLVFSIYGTNLLDAQVQMADPQQLVNSLPARAGRAVYFNLSYRL